MPSTSLDFGLFIAYFIPGVATVWALSLLFEPLAELFDRANDDKRLGSVLALVTLSLVTGMVVSILRAGVVDHTFEVSYPFLDCTEDPQFGSVRRVDPDYDRLADQGRREAFLQALGQEKRLYQFYGNSLLAILIAGAAWSATRTRDEGTTVRRQLTLLIIGSCAVIALYGGARMSHYRFMRAVTLLNGRPFLVYGVGGKPCGAPVLPIDPVIRKAQTQ
jgi:uncharacterized membrane protein YuzA (DUF378 family)